MGDDIGRTELPLQAGQAPSEPVYRVKPADGDSKRNPREQFEEHLKREKQDDAKRGAPDAQKLPDEAPLGVIQDIKDDVILSENARQILNAAPPAKPVVAPDEKDREPPMNLPPVHIDIIA